MQEGSERLGLHLIGRGVCLDRLRLDWDSRSAWHLFFLSQRLDRKRRTRCALIDGLSLSTTLPWPILQVLETISQVPTNVLGLAQKLQPFLQVLEMILHNACPQV